MYIFVINKTRKLKYSKDRINEQHSLKNFNIVGTLANAFFYQVVEKI